MGRDASSRLNRIQKLWRIPLRSARFCLLGAIKGEQNAYGSDGMKRRTSANGYTIRASGAEGLTLARPIRYNGDGLTESQKTVVKRTPVYGWCLCINKLGGDCFGSLRAAGNREEMAEKMGRGSGLSHGGRPFASEVLRAGDVSLSVWQSPHGTRPQLFHWRCHGAI